MTRLLSTIVKAIKNAAVELVDKLQEAERQAEIDRLAWLAEKEKCLQEEDRRRVQQSIKESQSQLIQIIQAWSDVMNLERFFQEVNDRAQCLPAHERDAVLERLKLAREFAGTQKPLDFFLGWKTPIERYQPLSTRTAGGDVNKNADDVDDPKP